MSVLTLRREWLEPGFSPGSLYEGPFEEIEHRPLFDDIATAALDDQPFAGSLLEYGQALAKIVEEQLAGIRGPIHCLVSGGYDSRAIAFLLERLGKRALYVSDGTQEPSCTRTLDHLGVPADRRYVHDLEQPDPYGLVDATCDGYGPIYSQLRFFPSRRSHATLVTGLGGGEWFSYPAAGWHRGKKPRLEHSSLRNMWVDCWPQFSMLPVAWARGYKAAIHPYCTVAYAEVANRARPEWLHENTGQPTLDAVRKALLDSLDPELATLGWEPHRYDFRLGERERAKVDARFRDSWLCRAFGLDALHPSAMTADDHACTLGGFSQWCDELIAEGHEIRCA